MLEAAGGALTEDGYVVDRGSSYIQTVTFDERGPVAEAVLNYGQSSLPGSDFACDQLEKCSEKEWIPLPFRPEDVAGARDVLRRTVQ